ncbi:MAG: 50S ribosomal protein L28 [Dehalococcoidia bacterium]|nr:50S ribosomal protein L28 [Dehalococcoidia bacterium]
MARCWVCGKEGIMGRAVSHSKRHTPHRNLPNVHKRNLVINGEKTSLYACTRCVRTQYKQEKVSTKA